MHFDENAYNHLVLGVEATLCEESRPSKYEADSHKILTKTKKGGSSNTALRVQTNFPFWFNPILFPRAVANFILSAFKYKSTLSKYEL